MEKASPHTTPNSPQGPRIWAAGFGKEARAQGAGGAAVWMEASSRAAAGKRAPAPRAEGTGAPEAPGGRRGCRGPKGGAGGGGAGVPAAEVLGKREGQHLRNPPPAAAAAASLRPGELSARRARLPQRRQPPAALAPRKRAAAASGEQRRDRPGGGEASPGRGAGHPRSSALEPRQGQVSDCGAPRRGRREAGRKEVAIRARAALPFGGLGTRCLPALRGAAADFCWRIRKAERGRGRGCVCVARTGAGAGPRSEPILPATSRQPPEGTGPCGPRPEARGLSPRALLAAFVAGARKPGRGMGAAAARRERPGGCGGGGTAGTRVPESEGS